LRHYQTFPIAFNELKRELGEMGIRVQTKSVQNLNVENNPDWEMMELQNYIYTVTQPDYRDFTPNHPAWCEAEFKERTETRENPGEAWKLREAYWKQFLNSRGKFDYAYPQRMSHNLNLVIKALQKDLNTRRAFLPIIDIIDDDPDDFGKRFPCSLGYLFQYRQDGLNMTYLLRSSDFFEHFTNDIWLANKLQYHVAEKLGVKVGYFCHWIGSFHCFAKNVKEVF
jgi:thymidylate synthase